MDSTDWLMHIGVYTWLWLGHTAPCEDQVTVQRLLLILVYFDYMCDVCMCKKPFSV